MLSYLTENKCLLPIDLFFAKRLLNTSTKELSNEQQEKLLVLLATLMASYRKGDVCLNTSHNSLSFVFPGLDLEKRKLLETCFSEAINNLPDQLIESMPEDKEYVQKPLCKYANTLYLQKNWHYETRILKEIGFLLKEKPSSFFSEGKFIKSLQEKQGLEEAQKRAIRTAFYQRLTLISGGPGTGKTYTASQMIEVFSSCINQDRKLTVLLCAPTGKASFHLKSKMTNELLEKVDLEAMTLHSLLKLFPDRMKELKRDIFSYDLIIVDEASMIDLRIMANLLASIDTDTRIVLIGDKNQLAPIEAGQVFAELCTIKSTVYLEKTHRFSNPTMIEFVQSVSKKNVKQALLSLEKQASALNFHTLLDHPKQLESYLANYQKPQKESFDPVKLLKSLKNFQILSALKQGRLGVDHINKWIVSELIGQIDRKSFFSSYFAFPILITSNDHKKNLFNGMMGYVITRLETFTLPFGRNAKAYFEDSSGKVLEYSLFDLPKWELGYAISVHKSQGSEFEQVVVVVPDGSESFGKELLYTAATRARKKIILLSKKPTLTTMIEKSGQKMSLLQKRLNLI